MLLCQINIRGPDEGRARENSLFQLLYRQILGLRGQSSSKPELAENGDIIFPGGKPVDLLLKLLLKALIQLVIVILHFEIDFIYDGKGRDLIHRGI